MKPDMIPRSRSIQEQVTVFFIGVIVGVFIAFLLIALYPAKGYPQDKWTRADLYREGAYQTLHYMDMLQTLQIAKHPERWHEKNKVLGKHPTQGDVIAYFLLTSLGHGVITHLMPRECRPIFQYITIGMRAGTVAQNLSIGIDIKF